MTAEQQIGAWKDTGPSPQWLESCHMSGFCFEPVRLTEASTLNNSTGCQLIFESPVPLPPSFPPFLCQMSVLLKSSKIHTSLGQALTYAELHVQWFG